MLQDPHSSNPIDIPLTISTISTVLTLIFSLTTLILTIILFNIKNKKEDDVTERKLKIDWFNKLILDYNLPYFHSFFENLAKELEQLKTPGLTDDDKEKIFDKIKDYQKDFRVHFADSLLAVDKILYNEIINISDTLIDGFTNAAFDPGIKLSHPPKFDEKITVKLTYSKTKIIQELFKFDGNLNTNDLEKIN